MGLLGSLVGKQQKVQFIVKSSGGENAVIQFDASMKENHKRDSPPTEFPVENGDTISDHVILKPFSLELTGIISDTPIGGTQGLLQEVATTLTQKLLPPVGVVAVSAAYALFSSLSQSKSPSVAAYGQLLKLQADSQPFDVLTSLYRYESMWIKSISAPRDDKTGKCLMFTVEVVQLILVTPQSVNIQVFANPGLAANKANVGQQSAKEKSAFQQGFEDVNGIAKKLGGKG